MTGNKKLDTILILVMLLLTLATAGIFYYTEFLYKKPTVNVTQEKAELLDNKDARAIPHFLKIEKMVISLIPKDTLGSQANSRMRWLEIEMHLVLFQREDEVYISENIAIVKDRIIDIASRMGADELNSVSGKILLEDRLKREINKAMLRPVVKNIFFASFIVQ